MGGWFHGGRRGLDVGDLVLPAAETGVAGCWQRQWDLHFRYRESAAARSYRPDRVYVSTSPAAATTFAGMLPGCHVRAHADAGCSCDLSLSAPWGGDVYRVQPVGRLEQDADDMPWPAFARAPAARVVEVFGRGAERLWISQPVDPAAPWFHGGTPGLEPGDVLRPGDQIEVANGIGDAERHWSDGWVFFTQRRQFAAEFASQHPFGDERRAGDVYVVEPIGELSNDPMLNHVDGIAATARSARIVQVLRRGVRRLPLPDSDQGDAWLDRVNAIRRRHGLDDLDPDLIDWKPVT